MIAYCPWCGAPIPDELHTVSETRTTLCDHKIICVRCREVSYFQDGWQMGDEEIAKLLLEGVVKE